MSTLDKVICDKEDLVSIANAIRVGTGSTQTFNVSELGAAAEALVASGGANITEEVNEYTGLLGELEATVNALPEAGGGANVETCTVTLNTGSPADKFVYVSYVDLDGNLHHEEGVSVGSSIVVRKGTIISLEAIQGIQGDAQRVHSESVYVYGDCLINQTY